VSSVFLVISELSPKMNAENIHSTQHRGGVCHFANGSHLQTRLRMIISCIPMLANVANGSHLQQRCCRIATLLHKCHCVWSATVLQMCNTLVLQNCHTVADRSLLQDCPSVAKLLQVCAWVRMISIRI